RPRRARPGDRGPGGPHAPGHRRDRPPGLDRRHHEAGRGGGGGGRPARGDGGPLDAPLRGGPALGARGRPRPQGRPGHRAADPGLPRAAGGARRHRRRGGGGPVSLLTVGISHRTAPMSLVEQVVFGSGDETGLEARVVEQEDVTEAVVVSTCNRVEVYTEAETFHGALAQVGGAVAAAAGVPMDLLTEHLYVHYEDR